MSRTISNSDRASLMHGFTYVSGTSTVTPPSDNDFCCIHALSDTVLSAVSGAGISGSLTGATIKAGDEIFGTFYSVKLTSGAVILYNSGL